MPKKEIIAKFLGTDESAISANTLINRQALKSSIFLHRMYGKLADAGFVVADYSNISTFGELEAILNGISVKPGISVEPDVRNSEFLSKEISQIGIDIEEISSLPVTNDFRNEGFYKDNFNGKEIAYCIIQPNPYASFAGLFAVKEAIVKADNKLRSVPFKEIVITHTPEGKPKSNYAEISISHTQNTAVGIAIIINNFNGSFSREEKPQNESKKSISLIIATFALVISFLTLVKLLFFQ